MIGRTGCMWWWHQLHSFLRGVALQYWLLHTGTSREHTPLHTVDRGRYVCSILTTASIIVLVAPHPTTGTLKAQFHLYYCTHFQYSRTFTDPPSHYPLNTREVHEPKSFSSTLYRWGGTRLWSWANLQSGVWILQSFTNTLLDRNHIPLRHTVLVAFTNTQ